MRDVLITILPEFPDLHIAKSMETLGIWQYWKYANMKIAQILNSKINCF